MLTVLGLAKQFKELHLYTKAKQTNAQYGYCLDYYILPWFGEIAAHRLRRENIVLLHKSMSKTPYMANRCIAVLSSMYNWRFGKVGYNPAKQVPLYKETVRKERLSNAQLASLGSKLSLHPDRDFVNAILLLLYTGCRKQEILGLTWGNVDLEAGLARIDGKEGERYVALNEAALEILRTIPNRDGFVIKGRFGRGRRKNINKAWTALGIGIRIHGLRHNFGSMIAASGKSDLVLGELLGHKDARSSRKYAHMRLEEVRRESNDIGMCITKALKSSAA